MPSENPLQNGIVQPSKPGAPGATPVGQAGSIPTMNGQPGRPAGSPNAKPAGPVPPPVPPKPTPPPDPLEALNHDTIKNLRLTLEQGVDDGEIKNIESVKQIMEYLAKKGWDTFQDENRIIELMDKYKVDDEKEFFVKLYKGELENPQLDVNGVNQTGSNPKLKGSSIMAKKIVFRDGALVEASVDSADVTSVLNRLSQATRKVEAGVKAVATAKLIRSAAEGLDLGGDDMPEPMKDAAKGSDKSVSEAVKALKSAVEELADALGESKDLGKKNELGAKDADDLDSAIDKGDGALDKADDVMGDVPMLGKGLGAEAGSKDASRYANKDEKKVMDIAMGEKGSDKDSKHEKGESKKEEKDEHKGGKGEKDEKDDKKPWPFEKKVSAAALVNELAERIAALTGDDGFVKEAQLYPFKDLNKTNVDDINPQTAKDQSKEINSEIKGEPAKDKKNQRIAPTDILDGGLKADYQSGASKTVDIKTAEKIRQHSVTNAVAKSKLAVELASQQQLKGLLDNPLKIAMVKNMVEAGINKEAAEVIAHNSFVDGYETSQTLVMKEAFDTFMKQTLDEFVKVAKYTQDYTVKEASAELGTESTVKTASVAPLRAASSDNKSGAYSKYWTQVASDRRKW